MRTKVTLLIPTLNEIGGMKAIMPTIPSSWYDQIIILDGGSTDGTIEYSQQQGYTVYVQKKRGLRNAYVEVWPQVIGDIVITFSPDGNSIAALIPKVTEKMREGYEMVIVSRYLDHAKSEDDTWLTGFGNWLFTASINLLHGGHYTDSLVIFRAYTKDLPFRLDLHKDETYSTEEAVFGCPLSWEPLLSIRAAKRKLRVAEIPGDEPPRISGKEKRLIWRWGAAFYYEIIREVFWWR